MNGAVATARDVPPAVASVNVWAGVKGWGPEPGWVAYRDLVDEHLAQPVDRGVVDRIDERVLGACRRRSAEHGLDDVAALDELLRQPVAEPGGFERGVVDGNVCRGQDLRSPIVTRSHARGETGASASSCAREPDPQLSTVSGPMTRERGMPRARAEHGGHAIEPAPGFELRDHRRVGGAVGIERRIGHDRQDPGYEQPLLDGAGRPTYPAAINHVTNDRAGCPVLVSATSTGYTPGRETPIVRTDA